MRALLAPLEELGEYEEIKKMLVSKQACVALSGCVDSQKLPMGLAMVFGIRSSLLLMICGQRSCTRTINFMTGM